MRVGTWILAILQVLLLTQGAWGGGGNGGKDENNTTLTKMRGGEGRTLYPCTSEGVVEAINSFSPSRISCFSPTPITLRRSIILSNVSVDIDGNNFLTLHGAGLYHFILDNAQLTLNNLNITRTHNNDKGGAFVLKRNSKLIMNEVVVSNTKSTSLANVIYSVDSSVTLEYSTIYETDPGRTMMHLVNSNFTSIGSTITGNEDYSIYSVGGFVDISFCTFFGHNNQSIYISSPGVMSVESSILTSVELDNSTLTSNGYNIVVHDSKYFGDTDMVNTDPIMEGTIKYNKGATPTIMPRRGSPAINFVAKHAPRGATDQTGESRENNGAPDCGSYETDMKSGVTITPATTTVKNVSFVTFQINKPFYSGADVIVSWQTVSGTAIAGRDFVSSHGIVNWSYPNVAPYVIEVPLLENDVAIPESVFFSVILSSSTSDLLSEVGVVNIQKTPTQDVASGCRDGKSHCAEDAMCLTSNFGFTCNCKYGYSGTGYVCEDVNECMENPAICGPGKTCNNTKGGYTCTGLNDSSSSSNLDFVGKSKGTIMGAVIGGICVLCIVALGIFYWSSRRKSYSGYSNDISKDSIIDNISIEITSLTNHNNKDSDDDEEEEEEEEDDNNNNNNDN